jgi:hypothetical protein
VVAEIYTEWAPLSFDTDLDDAVEKLTVAVQFSAQVPEVATAAKRNLALALFRRGWRSIKAGKAVRGGRRLRARDPRAGAAQGHRAGGVRSSPTRSRCSRRATTPPPRTSSRTSPARATRGAYLRAPYNKVGSQFFGAYADYRSANPQARQKAADEFTALQGGATGAFATKVRSLIASSWEYVAFDHWKAARAARPTRRCSRRPSSPMTTSAAA